MQNEIEIYDCEMKFKYNMPNVIEIYDYECN